MISVFHSKQVWDFYLYWGDPALHHFVVLAFVMGNADVILKVRESHRNPTACVVIYTPINSEELQG